MVWQLRVLEGQGEAPIALRDAEPHSGSGNANVTRASTPPPEPCPTTVQPPTAGRETSPQRAVHVPVRDGYAMRASIGAGLTLELGIGAETGSWRRAGRDHSAGTRSWRARGGQWRK